MADKEVVLSYCNELLDWFFAQGKHSIRSFSLASSWRPPANRHVQCLQTQLSDGDWKQERQLSQTDRVTANAANSRVIYFLFLADRTNGRAYATVLRLSSSVVHTECIVAGESTVGWSET